MKKTRWITVGTLAMSLGPVACDDESAPMGVPDEVETEETLEGWSEDMVQEARSEGQAPENVDKNYRPSAREEFLSDRPKEIADEAKAETRPSDEQ